MNDRPEKESGQPHGQPQPHAQPPAGPAGGPAPVAAGAAGDKASAREVFGARVDRYAELDVFSEEQFYLPLFELAEPRAGERVLDLAAGTGVLTRMIATTGAEVTAADITPEMLTKARERLAADPAVAGEVRFVVAGVPELPFDSGTFDLVTCRLAFHHFPDPAASLAEIKRVLAPGGRFVMEDVFGPEDAAKSRVREQLELLFDPSHVRAYPQPELHRLLLGAGFTVRRERLPYTKGLPVDFMLKLERIEDPADREEIVRLLKENLDVDLTGFKASEVAGELQLSWQTIILAATREA